MLYFTSDYMEGAHPNILKRLNETNLVHSVGYGLDEYSESAKEKIRKICQIPDADIFFLIGGTQTNSIVIDSMLESYKGVISADTGHINLHEAGSVEYTGHKIFLLPHDKGKIKADQISSEMEKYINDSNKDHMVMPGLVYISQPTEYGTLYSISELKQLRQVCNKYNLYLFADGARLAYALGSSENTVSLKDLAKLCDVFYIGGTKCGAFYGEAVVFPKHNTVPHFMTIMKQRGALAAKGRILGIQFDTLFSDNLYENLGKHAVSLADKIRAGLKSTDYTETIKNTTNQIFILMNKKQAAKLSKYVQMSFWEEHSVDKVVMRLVTSWATTEEDTAELIDVLKK